MAGRDADIFISGAGIAGLTAALALSESGFRVVLADPSPPPETLDDPKADLRSTAYLQPATQLFERIGIWNDLAPHATALDALRVIDSAGDPPAVTAERTFHSHDIGEAPFGWNVANWRTRPALTQRAEISKTLDCRLGVGFANMLARDDCVIVRLTDGTQVRAGLAIGADGRHSPLREAAGIDIYVTRYGQSAIVGALTHEAPHENVSTEIYRSGGAFTLVPMPDHEGRPASALVWMNDGPETQRLMSLPSSEFSDAASERSCRVLGAVSLGGRRQTFPVVTQRASHVTAPRAVLIAEAAHVMPPIGAQGLNTSLQDVSTLLSCLKGASDPGAPAVLARYARARETDLRARTAAIDLFNRVCRSDAPPVQALRRLGLKLAHDARPLRRGLMRLGMGESR